MEMQHAPTRFIPFADSRAEEATCRNVPESSNSSKFFKDSYYPSLQKAKHGHVLTTPKKSRRHLTGRDLIPRVQKSPTSPVDVRTVLFEDERLVHHQYFRRS
uniref:Uncharacterized protein n=1 Tax=Ascaris lumbricoides TaxID=6252 RepID=A0A0M3I1J5_ASCLU